MLCDDPGLTPGFVHQGNSRPMSEFYHVPADSSAPWTACPFAVVVSKLEFVYTIACKCHGERTIGNAD